MSQPNTPCVPDVADAPNGGLLQGVVSCTPAFQAGDAPPTGYVAWHEWAAIQHKAGLRQVTCGICGRWNFPQELSKETVTHEGTTRKYGGVRVKITKPVCLKCAANDKLTDRGANNQ